jgi:hypothetical protein
MWKQRAFHPQVWDPLEARVVPSLASAPPLVLLGHPLSMPAPLPSSDQARQAFETFIANFSQMVDTAFVLRGPSGPMPTSANLPAFDARITQQLSALADSLVSTLGNVPASAPLVAQVRNAITGDSPDSLKSQLLALAAAAAEQGSSTQALVTDSIQATRRIDAQVAELIPMAGPTLVAQGSTPATEPLFVDYRNSKSGSATQAIRDVQSAFSGFLTTYFTAVRDVLLAADASGTIDPSANRALFDNQVNKTLQALSDRLSRDLADTPAALALTARVQDAVMGEEPESLAAGLAILPTPAGPEAALVREFTLSSFRAITNVFALISGDISKGL